MRKMNGIILSFCAAAFLSGCGYSMKNGEVTPNDYSEVVNASEDLMRYAKTKERRKSDIQKEIAIYNGEKLSSVLHRLGKLEGVYYYLDKRSTDLELKGVDGYKIYNFNDLRDYVNTILPDYDIVLENNHYYKNLPKVVRVVERNKLSELDAIEFDSRYLHEPSHLFNVIASMLKRKGWSVIDTADAKDVFNSATEVNFQGSLRKFIEYFAKNNNLFVDFDYTKKEIVFSRYKTKTFPLNVPNGTYSFTNSLNMDTSSSRNQKSSNALEVKSSYDAIASLKEAMERIFGKSGGKSGERYWVYLDSVNQLVVRADPVTLKAVEEVVKNLNSKALKQIMVKLTVYEVSLDRNSQFGIDWSYVYKEAMKMGVFATNGAPPNFSVDLDRNKNPSVFKYTSRNGEGLSFIVNLLKHFGKTKLAYQMPVVTTNNIPAVYNIANKKSYIKSLTINTYTQNNNGTLNLQVEQGDAVSGEYIYIKPTVLSDDRLMLSLKMIFSIVKDIQKQSFQNGMYVQSPEIDENVYSQNVIINEGEKVIIGGFTLRSLRKNFDGLTDKPSFLTGLDKDGKNNKEIVMIVEAKEI